MTTHPNDQVEPEQFALTQKENAAQRALVSDRLPINRPAAMPSWHGQVQTERPAKDEGDEPQAQER
jgi:hypothetical protein